MRYTHIFGFSYKKNATKENMNKSVYVFVYMRLYGNRMVVSLIITQETSTDKRQNHIVVSISKFKNWQANKTNLFNLHRFWHFFPSSVKSFKNRKLHLSRTFNICVFQSTNAVSKTK